MDLPSLMLVSIAFHWFPSDFLPIGWYPRCTWNLARNKAMKVLEPVFAHSAGPEKCFATLQQLAWRCGVGEPSADLIGSFWSQCLKHQWCWGTDVVPSSKLITVVDIKSATDIFQPFQGRQRSISTPQLQEVQVDCPIVPTNLEGSRVSVCIHAFKVTAVHQPSCPWRPFFVVSISAGGISLDSWHKILLGPRGWWVQNVGVDGCGWAWMGVDGCGVILQYPSPTLGEAQGTIEWSA